MENNPFFNENGMDNISPDFQMLSQDEFWQIKEKEFI